MNRLVIGLLTMCTLLIGCQTKTPNAPDVPIIPNPLLVEGGIGVFVFQNQLPLRLHQIRF